VCCLWKATQRALHAKGRQMEDLMDRLDSEVVLSMQKAQYKHDKRNHFDILSRHKIDRLKHYGAHFSKYAGRLARGENASGKSKAQTAIDSFLVSLSAANTLSQRLSAPSCISLDFDSIFRAYTDAQGRFNDGVEKIDHGEFDGIRAMMLASNQELFDISFALYSIQQTNIQLAVHERRSQLAARAFFVED